MYNEALISFKRYIENNFDTNDEQVKHKLNHTFYVVNNSEYICNQLKLSKEKKELAKVIALLHDFGRFEQARIYNSFREDLGALDHATLGVKLLFEENVIRKIVIDNSKDELIKSAIANHSKYMLDINNMTDEEILQCKIIRDADKLDSFRAKLEEDITVMAGISVHDIENSLITDKVLSDFMNEKTIISKDRKTAVDIWTSYIAFIFDLNYDESLKYIKDNNYIDKLINKYEYKQIDTQNKMNQIKEKANEYINSKIK